MTREELGEYIRRICHQIDTVMAHDAPELHFIGMVWGFDDTDQQLVGRISTVEPDDIADALALLANPGTQLAPTESVRRDTPDNRN